MQKLAYLMVVIFYAFQQPASTIKLSEDEKKLYQLINTYRKTHKLPPIPLSKSLTFVAQTHAKDLATNKPVNSKCNLHSWSDKGNWTSCCYTSDHKKATCMWNKPRELTSYKGNGYEISYSGSLENDPDIAKNALNTWKASVPHNNVIINQANWKNRHWNAIGIGIKKGYAMIWFGEEKDEK